jgi:AcrR family transcriptional regulator
LFRNNAPKRRPVRYGDRVPRAKQRTQALRDHVLDVAVELLARDGVDAFTTRRIARTANTSVPAVYELFGDKTGLVREIFFHGFHLLRADFDALADTADPRADLLSLIETYRQFVMAHPVLAQVMFSRPFSAFAPGPGELQASAFVRTFILTRVRRCIEAGVIDGDDVDIAQVLVALVQGLAAAESSQRLGSTPASVDRRWALAVDALLAGFAARPTGGS